MTSDEVGALVAVIGLLSQSGGALLLVCLFAALLRSHPRPQPYFRQWTRGWIALAVALAGVGVQYAFPGVMAAEPLAPRAANLVYQAGKLLFVACLLAGPLDRVYRWGGDEFLLLFPAALPEEVVPRVRGAIGAVPELEVSLGAAAFSGTEDLPAALELADRAMYEEKTRNRAGRAPNAALLATHAGDPE